MKGNNPKKSLEWPKDAGKKPYWWRKVQKAIRTQATVLDLTSENLQLHGVKILVDHGLEHCPKLTEIFLGDNGIGDGGARAMAERGLRHCPDLKMLDVFFDGIGEQGATALIEHGLPCCPKLAKLYLEDNPMNFSEDVSRARFAQGLVENLPLTLTSISGVKLNEFVHPLGLPRTLKMSSNERILQFLHERAEILSRSSKDSIMDAVRKRGRDIRYASPDLRRDRDVILGAVESSGNEPFPWETCTVMWTKIERSIDQKIVRRMRRWCNERHGNEVGRSMSFHEVHAQYVSFPEGTAGDRHEFPDLGWVFRKSLENDPGEEDTQSAKRVKQEDEADEGHGLDTPSKKSRKG